MKPEELTKLEQLIDQACREQPDRKAPMALQTRVFAELERRAALPWWRKSFVHWPISMRVAFVALCFIAAQASLNMSTWFDHKLAIAQPVNRPMSWLQNVGAFISFIHSLSDYVGTTLLHRVPSPLLYGGALGVLMMYGLLIGLSAAAYRTFFAAR